MTLNFFQRFMVDRMNLAITKKSRTKTGQIFPRGSTLSVCHCTHFDITYQRLKLILIHQYL